MLLNENVRVEKFVIDCASDNHILSILRIYKRFTVLIFCYVLKIRAIIYKDLERRKYHLSILISSNLNRIIL